MKYPIYIPSKGRADIQKTVKLLKRNNINNYYVVVEKAEKYAYLETVEAKNLLVLPGSNYGTSSFARNYCIEHSIKQGFKKHWQFDDDITYVMKHDKGKALDTDLQNILTYMETISDSSPMCAVIGMKTINFLRQVTSPLTYNTSLTSIYLLKNTSIRFRGTMYVDMDYQLQCLKRGYTTIRCNDHAFRFITALKHKGGYYNIYSDDKKRMAAIKEFLKLNPEVDPTVERGSAGFLQLTKISAVWRKYKK